MKKALIIIISLEIICLVLLGVGFAQNWTYIGNIWIIFVLLCVVGLSVEKLHEWKKATKE